MRTKKLKLDMKKILGGNWQVVDLDDDNDEEVEPESLTCEGSEVARWMLQNNDKLYFPKQTIHQVGEMGKKPKWQLHLSADDFWWKLEN